VLRRRESALTVVIGATAYPLHRQKGARSRIFWPASDARGDEDFHAGTREVDGALCNGGALSMYRIGPNSTEAQAQGLCRG